MRERVLAYTIDSARIGREWARVGNDREAFSIANVLHLEEVERRRLAADDVRARVLAVSAEHNIVHSSMAEPVDIAAALGGRLYPGNSFVGEVLEVGATVTDFKPGDIVAPAGTSRFDANGYPLKTWGFDDPLPGCYAEEVVLPASMLFSVPLDSGLSFWQIAALPLRAANAYHLWRRAYELFRVKVPRERLARMNVLAFGGGVSELFLMLARAAGHDAFYCAGNRIRRDYMESLGIHPIDQLGFHRFAEPKDVIRFRGLTKRLTNGVAMHVVCDMFRGPLFEAGLAALARGGVNISAGWQLQNEVKYASAALSLRQITLDHAHVETMYATQAVASLFGGVFRPLVHPEIYRFADLPRAIEELRRGEQNGFGVIRVANDLPGRVATLLPQ